MMRNSHYLGDDFYPAIIDKESFDAVEAELSKRSTKRGRNDRYNSPKAKRPPTAFRLGDITENYDNPIRQSEYLYSLIESEVILWEMLWSSLQEGKLEILPDNRMQSLSSESRRTAELVPTAMSRLQVMKLRLSITQNLSKRTLNENLQAYTLMMVFPVPTLKTVTSLIA